MKYGSVCSGIEAASVAWESLGWQAQWYSEIEHFPSAVLAHRFPTVPNLGDMTQIHNTETFNGTTIDILVGGTPCQSFSVAGLRKGLDDTRGQLMLTFCELAARKRPKWVVWENVPGVLSSNKGEDLASFLGLLTGREIHPPVGGWKNSGVIEGIGSAYGVAWTVLDAQYFGVAQRRRRIFAIGYLGDWRPAAAVLFEYHRLSGDIKEGRKKRKATSSDAQGSVGGSSQYWGSDPECSDTVTSKWHKGSGGPSGSECGLFVSHPSHAFKVRGGSEVETGEQGGTPGKKAGKGYLGSDELAFTIGTTQDQQIAQPIAYSFDSLASNSMKSSNPNSGCREVETSSTIDATTPTPSKNQGGIAIAQPVPFRKARRAQSKDDYETWEQDEKTNTLNAFDTGDIRTTQAVVQPIAVDLYNGTIQGQITCTLTSEMGVAGHSGPKLLQPIAVDVYNQSIDGQTAATITEAVGGSNTSGPKIAQPIAVDCYNQTINEKTTQTIGSSASDVNHYGAVLQPTIIDRAAFNQGQNAQYDIKIEEGQTMSSLVAKGPHGVATQKPPTMAIRRLLPTECEILQGFPRNWTLIPYRNKSVEHCPDGPRYKACGNSMAVPVMAYLGRRIQMVEDILKQQNDVTATIPQL